jgi:hypothetical protein
MQEREKAYPNKWRENMNLQKVGVQITNRNRFAPNEIVTPGIKNLKYLE